MEHMWVHFLSRHTLFILRIYWVNGERIGEGLHRRLRHDSQIALGTTSTQPNGEDHCKYS